MTENSHELPKKSLNIQFGTLEDGVWKFVCRDLENRGLGEFKVTAEDIVLRTDDERCCPRQPDDEESRAKRYTARMGLITSYALLHGRHPVDGILAFNAEDFAERS